MKKSGKQPDLTMDEMMARIENAPHAPVEEPMPYRGSGYVVDVVEGYERECLAELRKRRKKGLRP